MKMDFTYDEFKRDYLRSDALIPTSPLKPVEILNHVLFSETLAKAGIDDRIRDTFTELRERMGEEYFSKFKRVQARASEIASLVFPPYKMLFLDITCEDWLSLIDFHKGFNRDHSIHQPLTAYIVCKLLGGGNPDEAFKIGGKSILEMAAEVVTTHRNSNYLLQRLVDYDNHSTLLSGDKGLWMSIFYQTAIITAMYHDLGYPWQFIENMHKTLDDEHVLNGKLPKGNQRLLDYLAENQQELMFCPFYNYSRNGETPADINVDLFESALHCSHGLPGALAFRAYNKKYNVEHQTQNSQHIRFCQEWICMAIMMHDMAKIYLGSKGRFPQLDFTTDPLSYIIALADTLEDFNRPNANIKKNDMGCNIEYTFPTLSVSLEEDQGYAIIKYSIEPANREKQDEYKREDQKNLFEPGGYFNLPSIGLTKLDIQCV